MPAALAVCVPFASVVLVAVTEPLGDVVDAEALGAVFDAEVLGEVLEAVPLMPAVASVEFEVVAEAVEVVPVGLAAVVEVLDGFVLLLVVAVPLTLPLLLAAGEVLLAVVEADVGADALGVVLALADTLGEVLVLPVELVLLLP